MRKKSISVFFLVLFACLIWHVPAAAGILDETIEVNGKILELNYDYSDGIVLYDYWSPEETIVSVGSGSGAAPDGMHYVLTTEKKHVLTGAPTKEGVFTFSQTLYFKTVYAPGEVFEKTIKFTVAVKKAETEEVTWCCLLGENDSYDINLESADEAEVIVSDLPDGMSYVENAAGAQIVGIPKETGEFSVKIRLCFDPVQDKAPKYKNVKIVVIDPKNSSEEFVAEKGVHFSELLILSEVNHEITGMTVKNGKEPDGVAGTYSMAGTRISGTPEVSGRFAVTYEYTLDGALHVLHTVYLTIYEKTNQLVSFNTNTKILCPIGVLNKDIKKVSIIDGRLPMGLRSIVSDNAALIIGRTTNNEEECLVTFEIEAADGSLYLHKMYIQVKEQEPNTDDPVSPYEDVSKEDWFYEAVFYNYTNGLMTGMSDTAFGPYGSLSRAQFALILYRMEGTPDVDTEKSFGDISGTEWYGPAVLWAAENGIVAGYQSGNFGPADNITREQMALMMYRYANYLDKDTSNKADISGFADADRVSEFAKEAMMWANSNGIITGKENGTKLDPQGNTARAEAAAIIQRFMKN